MRLLLRNNDDSKEIVPLSCTDEDGCDSGCDTIFGVSIETQNGSSNDEKDNNDSNLKNE